MIFAIILGVILIPVFITLLVITIKDDREMNKYLKENK